MSKEPNRNVYVGHRYVPKIMGEWDNKIDYEGLSIVTNKGTSYTSKKRVPVGIDILNDEFWVVTGNYNAQVEYYRQDVVKHGETLIDEVARLDGKDTEISNTITDEVSRLDGKDTELSNTINNEVSRLDGKDTEINQTITDEVARLDGKDTEITQTINDEVSRLDGKDTEISNTITDEVSRLDGEDTELNNKLDEVKNQGVIPVTHFGVKGDGVTNDHSKLQDYITKMEEDGLPYMYFPTFNQDYYINNSLKFHEPDVRIFGDKGLQLLHPSDVTKKKGNILIGTNAVTGLDIGSYRRSASSGVLPTSRNPAGSWTIDGLSFKPANNVASFTKNGIDLTAMNNGPDRPYIFKNLSFNNLKNGIYMPPNPSGVSIMAANVNISNMSAYNNVRGILIDGRVYNMSVKESNLEGNTQGSVWGNISGSVDISNNMLELTKNPINIKTGSGGQSMHFNSESNYFEYHPTSDYLYKLDTGAYYVESSVNIKDNFYSGNIDMEYPVHLTGASLTNIDSQYKVLFDQSKQTVLSDSKVLENNGGYYAFNQLGNNPDYSSQASNLMVYMDNGFDRTDTEKQWVHDYHTTGELSDTPIGKINVKDLSSPGFKINQTIDNGYGRQLVVLNLMVKSNPENNHLHSPGGVSSLSIYDQAYNSVLDLPTGLSDIAKISKGKWVMVSIPITVNKSVTALNVMSTSTHAKDVYIAGATSRNYGAYVNDGRDEIKKIFPVRPNFKEIPVPETTE